VEAFGQYVVEEAPGELCDGDAAQLLAVAVGAVAPCEDDMAVAHFPAASRHHAGSRWSKHII
jgi:hypothetical protein